jgi:hypothetical protein
MRVESKSRVTFKRNLIIMPFLPCVASAQGLDLSIRLQIGSRLSEDIHAFSSLGSFLHSTNMSKSVASTFKVPLMTYLSCKSTSSAHGESTTLTAAVLSRNHHSPFSSLLNTCPSLATNKPRTINHNQKLRSIANFSDINGAKKKYDVI